MRRPDWAFWSILPSVELWQASALSLDIDPDDIDLPTPARSIDWTGGGFPDQARFNSFMKRLRLLVALRDDDTIFSRADSYPSDRRRTHVRLDEFARWAQKVSLPNVPGELFGLCISVSDPPRSLLAQGGLAHRQSLIEGANAQREAGRYTLAQMAFALAEQSEMSTERWLQTLVDAVRKQELALSNPDNFRDTLPYPVSDPLRPHWDQVSAHEVNRWLATNPQWGAFRLNAEFVADAVDAASTPMRHTNKKKWDDGALRSLWNESNEPGASQEKLAAKHKVSRQRIAALLKRARDVVHPAKRGTS